MLEIEDRGSHAQYQVGASKILRLVKETNSSNELEELRSGFDNDDLVGCGVFIIILPHLSRH